MTGSFQSKRAFGTWGIGLPFGLVLLAFGAVSVVFAGPVARFWIVVWAVVAVLSGVWDVASALMNEQHGRGIRLARGVILALAGVGVLVAPLLGYLFLGLAIGISCMLVGISTIAMGLAVRHAEL